jgi:hypothetical protein
MITSILSVEEVREHIADKPELNHLLEGEEFSATRVLLAMEIAVNKYNMIIPISNLNAAIFPNKFLLLYGTLATLFEGQCALLARNTMSYTDGGISIPVEERMQLYQSLAAMYGNAFDAGSRAIKLQGNIEDGWGSVGSDYANMPIW